MFLSRVVSIKVLFDGTERERRTNVCRLVGRIKGCRTLNMACLYSRLVNRGQRESERKRKEEEDDDE